MSAATMDSMTAPAIAAAAARGAGVLLPVGVIETHGPHLPVATDVMLAMALCRATAGYCRREQVIAPAFSWGVNGVLGQFTGSFDIRPETAAMLLTDVLHSLLRFGFGEIAIVSHHGDLAHNRMLLGVVGAVRAAGHGGVRVLYTPFRWRTIARLGQTGTEPHWVPWQPTAALERFRTTGILGVHADEYETAGIARYYPETVDWAALRGLAPTALGPDDLAEWRTGGEAARRLTPDGYFGAPNPVDPELWRFYDETARLMAGALETGSATPGAA